ncbi:DinB family protein [Aliifodinibius sp. S!AR15-10]|uniref:DinB family protein n=1 Tax=Aliifodinibius sp. S!AR15-10 TaxID=2950437 RepID=UPI0028602AB9|nr:DinB family protein [Aliifodinibius sp. S!AR15-10]MDR8392104.1 DinB family protein [Aliifodinibius sp. S!AR15-10]
MSDSIGVQPYTYQWFINQFTQARDRSISFCQPLSEDIFVQRPAPETWSIAECYSHLNEFGNRYLSNIRRGMESAEEGKPSKSLESAFTPRLIWKGVIWLFAPPYRMKMKTVKPFTPKSVALKKTNVLDEFNTLQNNFIDELEQARIKSVDLDSVKVSNPLLTFIKMRLAECFAVVEVHQRRHLWQAEQILDKLQ